MTAESWRDGNVAQRHLYLLNSEFMADCTFVVGIAESERKFKCHKSILSQGSAVFYAMFNGELQEKGEVRVEDIEPQPFRKMLEFIYSDNTKLENAGSALSVCYAAHKYMINTLVQKCIDFIKEKLDPDTMCKALEFARLVDNADLEVTSLQYLQLCTSEVLKSASFLQAERETLVTILNQGDRLYITSEVEVFSACIRWAKSQGDEDNLRDVLGPQVLSHIRFLSMSAHEFASVVIPSKVLEAQEACDILCRIITKTGDIPRGFNTNTETRAIFGLMETIEIQDYIQYPLTGEEDKNTDKMMELDESWRDGSLAERNLHMLDSQLMTDCTFVVGITEKKKFQCHKFVLCQGSSVFYAMFNGELKETGEVKVEDIEPQHFGKMIEFIYSNNTDLGNVESALCVCYAANKYMINTLTLTCIDFIKKYLNPDIVCRALEFARLINNSDLEAESLQYLQTNTHEVFNSASFLTAEKSTLLIILNQDTLSVDSEVEVFAACIRWAGAQQRDFQTQTQSDAKITLRELLGLDVLSLIRFLTMTCEEFATIVARSGVLQLQEERHLFCCISAKSGFMPQGFNINTKPRTTSAGPKDFIEIRSSNVTTFTGQSLNGYLFNFNIDVESIIYGLQMRGLYSSSAAVEDSFKVDLMLASKILASAKFKGVMCAGKTVEVCFEKHILLKANTTYTLKMKYSNLNSSYSVTDNVYNIYTSEDGVTMKMNFAYTNIAKIYIAKKI